MANELREKFIEVKREEGQPIEVGMGATGRYWTDTYAYEVVRIISDKTVEIRRLRAEMLEGHNVFDDPEYEYFTQPDWPVERVRKCKYGWKTKDGMRVTFWGAREYYDPCF